MLRLAVLDVAGTTVMDEGQVPGAFADALAAHGLRLAPGQIDRVRGASKREAIARLLGTTLNDERARAVYAAFRARLAQRYAPGVREVPGARAAIDELRRAGVRVALTTGFDGDSMTMILTGLGWQAGVLDAVVCGDEVAHGRPAPDLIREAMARTGVGSPAEVMNAGDTTLDLRAGHRAGVRWNVGVLSGAHDAAALSAAPHTHLVASVAELPRVWEGA